MKCTFGPTSFWYVALLVALFTVGTDVVFGQQYDWYNDTAIASGKFQQQNNLILSTSVLDIGWNGTTQTEDRRRDVVATNLNLRRFGSKLYFFAAKNADGTSLEAKLNQEFGKRVTVDIGFGSDDIAHAGVRWQPNVADAFEVGLSYVVRQGKREVGGWLAKYWNLFGIFTGVRKSNSELLTIISKPAEHGWAFRYSNTISLTDRHRFQQLIVGGQEGAEYYNLSLDDSRFYLRDDSIIGSSAVSLTRTPFRYIVPPVAWLIRDRGGSLTHLKGRNQSDPDMVEVQLLEYLSEATWIGAAYTSGNTTTVSLQGGRTSSLLKLLLRATYVIRDRGMSARVILRYGF